MFEKIFGNKVKMIDMNVYWKNDVSAEELVEDLNSIGHYICMHNAFENGCRIITVGKELVDGTEWISAELYVDEKREKQIRKDFLDKKFKAVHFTKTFV